MSEYSEALKLVAKPIIINALHKRAMHKADLVDVLRSYDLTALYAAHIAQDIVRDLVANNLAYWNNNWLLELKK